MDHAERVSLTCLMEQLREKQRQPPQFWHRSPTAKAVELVVDAVDPKIRVVSRYNKRLREPVDNAWRYLDTLIDHIPGDLHISRRCFSIDPRVRVLFESADSMLKLFNQSQALSGFFESHREAENSFVLLAMEKKEHKFLGMELNGDMLKREVMQTSVTFSDHHILSPASNEESAKEGIKCYAFEGLLRKTQHVIAQSHLKIQELEEQKQQLATEIRRLKGESKNAESENPLVLAAIEKLHYELMEVERDIVQIRAQTESPNHHLQIIIDVLREPQQYLSIERKSLNVNNLGIKMPTDSAGHSHVIEYAEMVIEHSFKRVAMVVSFPRHDLL